MDNIFWNKLLYNVSSKSEHHSKTFNHTMHITQLNSTTTNEFLHESSTEYTKFNESTTEYTKSNESTTEYTKDYENTTLTQNTSFTQVYSNIDPNYSQELLVYLQNLHLPAIFIDTTFIGK